MTAPLRRDCIVTSVRLSGPEHEAFMAAAKRLKESRAHLLRRAVREIIGKPGYLFERELWPLGEAVYQLLAVRRNLNQITQATQDGKLNLAPPDRVTMEALQRAIQQLNARLVELIECNRLRIVYRR